MLGGTLKLSAYDSTVTLKPEYGNVYYVTFHEYPEGSETDVIQTKKIVAEGESVIIGDVVAPQTESNKIFYAWSDGNQTYDLYDDGQLISGTSIENVKANIQLYPRFVEAYWLRFVAGETGSQAEYVPARFVRATDTLTDLPVSTRKGYNFVGWFTGSMTDGKITYGDQVTDATGKVTNPSSGLKLTEETVLYAKWSAKNNAKYSVVIWRQRVSDDKNLEDAKKTYDYAESAVREGVTDEAVSASTADTTHSGGKYTGFHYARTVQNSTTIQADGSTVINVYYDRDLMAVNFYYQSGHQPDGAEVAYTYESTTSDSDYYQQYGLLEDGTYVELTRTEGSPVTTIYYTYYYGYYIYTGTFYRKIGSNYTATEYNGNNLPPEGDNNTYYTERIYGERYELKRQTATSPSYSWTYTKDGVSYPYTGTRYYRYSSYSYPYMVTWTGLYEQPFSKYGYVWPSDYKWNEQSDGRGTTQTFLTAFTQTDNPYSLYDQGKTDNYFIYHYKQGLDGNYSQVENDTRFTVKSGNGPFTFSKKFEGFTVDCIWPPSTADEAVFHGQSGPCYAAGGR